MQVGFNLGSCQLSYIQNSIQPNLCSENNNRSDFSKKLFLVKSYKCRYLY